MTTHERRVQVANISKFVQHLGPHAIEPGQSIVLSDPQWIDHPALQRLADAGALMLARDPLSKQILEKAEEADVLAPEEVFIEVASEAVEELAKHGAPSAPVGFDTWHTNKAKGWVKKQNDIVLLNALLVDETRDKVAQAIEARISDLEARP